MSTNSKQVSSAPTFNSNLLAAVRNPTGKEAQQIKAENAKNQQQPVNAATPTEKSDKVELKATEHFRSPRPERHGWSRDTAKSPTKSNVSNAPRKIIILVDAIVHGTINTSNRTDVGRYVEVKPLPDRTHKPGLFATFVDKKGKKITGRVEQPWRGFDGLLVVDTFATQS